MSGVVILGAGGQVGRELAKIIPHARCMYHTDTAENGIDLSDPLVLENKLTKLQPDIIFNAAALANVDLCERERKRAYLINGEAVKSIAGVARKHGGLLVHVSTDYVFDGQEGNYGEDSVPAPLNYYGLSKLIGDTYAKSYENTIIVRTSGVFGYNNNFPLFVLNKLRNNEPVTAIRGFYSPIHAKNLAESMKILSETDFRGLINVAGVRVSRREFALEIAKKFNSSASLVSESDNIASMNASRPYDSSLDVSLARSKMDFDFYSLQSNLKVFADRL